MENGDLVTYTEDDMKAGKAIGLQEKSYVRAIDLIDVNFMSVLYHDSIAKWQLIGGNEGMKILDPDKANSGFTQVRALPKVIKLPTKLSPLPLDLYFAFARQEISLVNART